MTEIAERPTRTKARLPALGRSIDALWKLREDKRGLETQLKTLEAAIAQTEETLLDRLEREGLDSARGAQASITLNRATCAQVEDWDALWSYIFKNKYTQLLHRRVSDPAYRELLELGKKVPGVQPYEKKRLSLRSL